MAARAGKRVRIIAKMNSLLEPEIISVRSVVGRFLEHTRVFYFYADGAQKMYLSSADWMDRNFFRRIELSFPVLEPKLKRRILKEGLMPYLADNTQAWGMNEDGVYRRKRSRKKGFSAQGALLVELSVATPAA